MSVGTGVALIVAGTAVGLLTVFGLWRRVPAALALAVVAACGMSLAAGGLLLQDDVGPSSWAFALVLLAILAPVHVRLVFGPPGRPRGPVVAPTVPAA